MKEREGREHWTLLPDTRQLLLSVEELTGRKVEIRSDPEIRGRGRAIYVVTDPDPNRHLILFDPDHERFLDHLVGHECGHILRFTEAEPADQCVPIMTAPRRVTAIRQVFPDVEPLLSKGISEDTIVAVMDIWLSGTIAQVADNPADIQIERWLWNEYPGIRKVQRPSLLYQVETMRQVLGRRVEALTPKSIWEASNAMNYALVRAIALVLGRAELLRPYKRTAASRIGEELFQMVEMAGDTGHAGDRKLSERWAERLGIEEWLEWRSLGSLPPNFRHAWE